MSPSERSERVSSTTTATDDPTDPFLRQAQTYPQLNPDQAARVRGHGVEEVFENGRLL